MNGDVLHDLTAALIEENVAYVPQQILRGAESHCSHKTYLFPAFPGELYTVAVLRAALPAPTIIGGKSLRAGRVCKFVAHPAPQAAWLRRNP